MHTESSSNHSHLEQQDFLSLVTGINREDALCHSRIANELPVISALCELIYDRLSKGGRLFYLGAGTSGRLGIVDASECPPTYGVPFDKVVGLIAGGDSAIRKAVEFAEDDFEQGYRDLEKYNIGAGDVVVGVAASGRTPYVIGALRQCRINGIATGAVVCNKNSAMAADCDICVEIETGPEFVTGSTRMKAGTATKMVLNMLTTSVMIRLGHVKGNKMIDMQLTNLKLIERGTRMVMEETGLNERDAKELLLSTGSVRKAVDAHRG
jgi:N-acetylmuramic acid 6-phosphate etherase